jgi:hypothetical protein
MATATPSTTELKRDIEAAYDKCCRLSHIGAANGVNHPQHQEYVAACDEHLRLKGLQYDTPDKRIAFVAHRWNRQYRYDAEYKAMGFSEAEIRKGSELGRARENEYLSNRAYYGDPAYGSWPPEAVKDTPINQLVAAMFDGDAMLLPEAK